ncbi:hypothetical protein ACMGD3_17935 [Lysinibacillus sphaericus]|uniref:hypothetical protein n=1 Tax=Lysinibacillus sphaericus TaxID=1421 RepID=UPI001C5EACB8
MSMKHIKKGLPIADMAKKQGISPSDLVDYFYDTHYKEMQKWRAKSLTERVLFPPCFRLVDELRSFLTVIPIVKSIKEIIN